MTALRKLTQGERIVLVGGLLLIVDLVLVPWHSVDLGGLDIDFDTTRTGIEAPNPGYGVAAVILTAIMLAQIVLSGLMGVRLPAPGLPWSQVHLIVGVFVAVVLAIKLFRETEFLGFGAYSGVLAGVLVAYGGWRISQEPAIGEP
jgi:hypothetical protein